VGDLAKRSPHLALILSSSVTAERELMGGRARGPWHLLINSGPEASSLHQIFLRSTLRTVVSPGRRRRRRQIGSPPVRGRKLPAVRASWNPTASRQARHGTSGDCPGRTTSRSRRV